MTRERRELTLAPDMEITPEKILEVQDLTKIYGPGCPLCLTSTGPDHDTNQCPHCGSVVACGRVSLELYPDEILGIVGESGSGKSTLVKLLFFDEEATSGEMYFRGKQFLSQNRAELPPDLSEPVNGENLLTLSSFQKRRIKNALMGMVYQYPHQGLRLEVSAGGNIAERLITAAWRHVGNMRQRAAILFEKTEIPVPRLDESPQNFSGGMQQRVQIAKSEPGGFGPVLENFVAQELRKQAAWSRQRPQLFHWRTHTQHEVDLVMEAAGRVVGIEVKASSTVTPDDFGGLKALAAETGGQFVRGAVLHTGQEMLAFGENLLALPISALWRLGGGRMRNSAD